MSETLKPAASEQEWSSGYVKESPTTGIEVVENGGLFLRNQGARQEVRRRHALAAFALHGQPFGFSGEDVDALRAIVTSAADAFEDEASTFLRTEQEKARRLVERAESAIARMEALLPSRE